eukprot:TRINITY_DN3030_c0_g1_i1.p2 TRINITY_DN3030_c0_g1~~TRINITY_DN3030_c0_g1_i1.p2  ORF type:complete len:310 (+),score=69.82 TRINITY_DN3030_c0_g1_i1:854-1783(+)
MFLHFFGATYATWTALEFINNTAAAAGGAVSVLALASPGKVEITSCNFTENSAADGGAMWIGNSSSMHVINVHVTDNTAKRGGGIYIQTVDEWGPYSAEPSFQARLANNTASEEGGALYLEWAAPSANTSLHGVISLRNSQPAIACGPDAVQLCQTTCTTQPCPTEISHTDADGCLGFGICVDEPDDASWCLVEPRYWNACGGHGHCDTVADGCNSPTAVGEVLCSCDKHYHNIANHTFPPCAGVKYADTCERDPKHHDNTVVVATVTTLVVAATLLLAAAACAAVMYYRRSRRRADAAREHEQLLATH